MNRIQRLVATGQRGLHVILISVLSFLLIVTGDTLSRYPAQTILATLYFPFFKVKQLTTDLAGVASENRTLHKALVDASLRISMLEEALRENVRLRGALGFEPPPGYTLIPAQLVSVTGAQIPITATVFHGATTGVASQQPVINRDGLVGRVVSITQGYASVELLTNPSNRVAARLVNSREMGIVKFIPGTGLMLDNFPVDGSIKVGDTVVSSGLGGVYPTGILIGTVASVEDPPDNPYSIVMLKPSVNFLAIEEIFLLRSTRQ